MAALLEFIRKEWYFFFPMLAMSLVGWALVLWRMLLNLGTTTNMKRFLPVVQETLDRQGVEGALRLCQNRGDLIPRRVYVAGLLAARQRVGAMRKAMADVIEMEVLPELSFLLAPILAIAKIGTMVGLLGTVISMINTFNALSTIEDDMAIAGHATHIGLALFATAMGLFTSIPLVFAHVLLKAWVHRFQIRMKHAADKLQGLVRAARSAAAKTQPAIGGSPLLPPIAGESVPNPR